MAGFLKVGRSTDVLFLDCILHLMVCGKTLFEHIEIQMKKWAISSCKSAISELQRDPVGLLVGMMEDSLEDG